MRQRGFNLVEILVVFAIMGILLGLGIPSYRSYMANQKVQSTAEVFMSGLQLARAEAVKLNQRVEFFLTDQSPTVASVDTTSTSATGANWMVRGVGGAVAADLVAPARALVVGGNTFVEGKSGAEGSSAGSPITVAGSVASIVFNGYGVPGSIDAAGAFVGLATTATFDFANPAAGNCAGAVPAGPVRCLRLRISRGGQSRLCDPAVAATDTRSCGI